MASASYSFLDIVVLEPVRERFAAGDALAILSVDLDEILWANGGGAAWLGYPDIEAAIGAPPRLPATALRQIAAAPGFPRIGSDRLVALRLTQGLASRIVTVKVSAITLPHGEDALLLAVPAPADEEGRNIVAGFSEPGHFAALIETDGSVTAASEGFEALGISRETLEALVEEVSSEADRLTKKHITGARGEIPAGIARLTDAPARHLLVLVDEGTASVEPLATEEEEEEEAASPEAPAIAEPAEERPSEEEPAPHGQHAEIPDDLQPTDARTASQPVETPAPRTVRFSWRTDAEGRFSALSSEFAEAMGEPAADVIGRTFREVSNAFGLDPDGAIARLLEHRDTWSGRTVKWPLAGTNLKVPIDLAALPVYGRGRVFEGFRGFGIIRLGEAEEDEEAIGTVLRAPEAPSEVQMEETAEMPETPSAEEIPETDPFLGEKPAISISGLPEDLPSDKVIRLSEHRESSWPGALTATERTAFREIGERLRRASEAAASLTEGKEEPPANVHELPSTLGTSMEETPPSGGTISEGGAVEADEDEPAQTGTDYQSREDQPAESSENAAEEGISAEAEEDRFSPPTNRRQGPDRAEEKAIQKARPQHSHSTVIPSAFFQPAQRHTEAIAELLAGLPLPVLIHSGDQLHYANREFLRITGYEDIAALEAAGGIDALIEEPSSGETPREKLSLRTAQGTEIPVEAHLQSVAWEEGRALMLALRTIPQTPENADEIKELETRLSEMHAIVDTATDGVAVIANDGTIRSINRPAEALFGFDAEHVTGKPFTTLFAIESQRTVQDYITALADNGVASVLNDGRQVIGREAQGRFIPLFITIGRLPGDSGYCAVLRDITQWKRAEEELTQARAQAERASSQKSDFLARVSHEIRTPLNAIIGFSELMIDEKFGPISNERYRDYLRDINRSGNHVLDLVNDLLDISKIEAGQQEMAYEAVSLNETLGQVVAMMQPQANSERVIIRSSLASRLPDVVADLRSVRQIAINLLSNAVRYTPAGGQVIVSTAYEKDGSVVLRVRDTGVGMSSAELDEAMKPFKQINTLRRKRGDGTGLGLPLTRAMVEANRAQFSIASTPGEGTLVEITFPPTRVLAD